MPENRPKDRPEIYDISPTVSEKSAVFPGDQSFARTVALDCAEGDAFTLSSIQTTVHVGAHCDAPSHYDARGQTIEGRDLDLYMGAAQVITVKLARGQRILPQHIESVTITAPRVLFKTGSFPNPNKWNEDFNALSPDLIKFLASKKVRLVGIDTPSIDSASAKELFTHHEVYKQDMAVLEGIVLDHVEDGLYTLIALPLKLESADASPVRAVLVRGDAWTK